MINGNVYDPDNPWHPDLSFVGRIDPMLCQRACGSVFLVHPEYVVTATHCLEQCAEWNVVFPTGQHRKIVEDHRIKKQDIAWCKLDEPVDNIAPVGILAHEPKVRQYAILTGWGKVYGQDDKASRLRWAGTRIARFLKNHDVQIEKGHHAPHASKGDSGSPILVYENGSLHAAGLLRVTEWVQKGLWHFCNQIPQAPSFAMEKERFERIVSLDYSRRAVRGTFAQSSSEDWRMIDKWLIEQQASEEKKQ